MWLAIAACTVAAFARSDNTPKPDPPPKSFVIQASSAYHTEPGCMPSVKAITYYRRAYAGWREKMQAPGPVSRVWYQDCDVLRRRAAEWRDRTNAARAAYGQWRVYQYDWRSWLPRNWYLVGSCETGGGGDPNWSHANSSYVSAFGISRSIYSRDAAVYGVPAWNDAHPPTPRQQYLAALGHYKLFGDGWGCPGP